MRELAWLDDEWAARCPSPVLRDARAAARRAAAALGRRSLWPDAIAATARVALTPRPSRSASSPPPRASSDEDTALLALYDDAATVASAALKLLPLDPAVTAGWLAELAPAMAPAARAIAADDGPLPAPAAVAIELSAPIHLDRGSASLPAERALRIGVGGPVGSGKSSLIAALCGALAGELRLGVVTNDIYTTEDAEFLRATGVLPDERIVAVQTGGCPHTAIRDDISRQPRGGRGARGRRPARSTSCSSSPAATT